MKNSKYTTIFVVIIVLFIMLQGLIIFNTSLLMHDLNEVIWYYTESLPKSKVVKILTETAIEWGQCKDAYDSALYYISGAFILFVLHLLSHRRKAKED